MKRFIWVSLLAINALVLSIPATYGQRKQEKPKVVISVPPFGNVEAITAAQLKDYLHFVASDEMEGRDTPSRGLNTTAKFIAMNMSRWGLKPVGDGEGHLERYFQKITITSRQIIPESSNASINGQSYKIGEDFIATGASRIPTAYAGTANGNLVYVGHGMLIKNKNINPYQGIDVKGKIIVVADAYPKGVNYRDLQGKDGIDYDQPETYAAAHGAAGIIFLPNSSTVGTWEQRHKASLSPSRPMIERNVWANTLPMITICEKVAATLFAGEKLDYGTIKKQMNQGVFTESFDLNANKRASFTVGVKVDSILTQNVVAVLEGIDPVLKNEYVAIGAHYDHIGMRQSGEGDRIYNGADDDGSGTVALLAMADALAKGPQPKRSFLFVWHAGEEKGLWGSEYITANPVVPIEKIITELNIDMIGRSKKAGDTKEQNASLSGPNDIYVIGSKMMSSDLAKLSEEVNNSFLKLGFNYRYDMPSDPERLFYRSDHYNYAKKGIPIIFYFDGIHEDYHGLDDNPDKIDYEKMERVTRTIYATGWKLANLPSRPKVDQLLPSQLLGN